VQQKSCSNKACSNKNLLQALLLQPQARQKKPLTKGQRLRNKSTLSGWAG
jgi:hypothetical protein